MRESVVNRALILPRLSYGVSSKALAVCWGPNALAAALLGTSVGWLWSLIPVAIGAVLHAFLRWMYAKDARIFEIYSKYSILANNYHPHVRADLPKPFERPQKVGRGIRF